VDRQSGPMINMGRGFNVRHSEFLDSIPGSVAYSTTGENQIYEINAGLIGSFPWLGTMGGLFETYKFNKLHFRIVSSSGTQQKGNYYMATQVDVEDAEFTGVEDLMGYRGAMTANIWKSAGHNCLIAGAKPLYIRVGDVPDGTDARLYDYGRFTIATEGCADASIIGKLYVDYDVTLYTPKVTLAGALNFWRSWTWPGTLVTVNTFINNLFGSGSTVIGGTAPNDYVDLVSEGANKIVFNYPGLYSLNWQTTRSAANATANVDMASLYDNGTTIVTTTAPTFAPDDGDSVVNSYKFSVSPYNNKVLMGVSTSTTGLTASLAGVASIAAQILVLAVPAIVAVFGGVCNYGGPSGSTAGPTMAKALYIATLNLATLTPSMLPPEMKLNRQAAAQLMSRVSRVHRDEIKSRIVIVPSRAEKALAMQVQRPFTSSRDRRERFKQLLAMDKETYLDHMVARGYRVNREEKTSFDEEDEDDDDIYEAVSSFGRGRRVSEEKEFKDLERKRKAQGKVLSETLEQLDEIPLVAPTSRGVYGQGSQPGQPGAQAPGSASTLAKEREVRSKSK